MECNRIAIYDFCQTIVDFETADEFVNYIRGMINNTHMLRVERFRQILIRLGILKTLDILGKGFHYYFNKRLLLYELKGLSESTINDMGKQYYQDVVKRHFISDIIESIKQNQLEGYEIVIVSASYFPVLYPFCIDFHINTLITNTFKYNDNGVFTGKLTDRDCIYKNKVKLFLQKFPEFVDQIDSKSYGDSRSDIPILNIAKQGYVISCKRHKRWVEKTNFEEIVWQ